MAIVTAEVHLEGIRPLMFHVFGPDSLPLEKQEKTGVAGHDPEEWRKTYTATKQGQLYLRPDYMFSCMVSAAKYSKSGRRGTLTGPMAASLQITDDALLLDRWLPAEPLPTDPEESVYLDIRSVRNPSTKGRNVRYRVTCCPGWHLVFHAMWEATIVSRGEFETVLNDAGTLVGLADGRSIGMGRFRTVDLVFAGNGDE